jgi:glucose/arabinose dehydrogenase
VRDGVLDPTPVSGGPASRFVGQSGALGSIHGYMNVVVHPRFAENHWIYLCYTKPVDERRTTVAVARATLKDGAMTEVRDVFIGDALGGAAAIAVTPDGMLWIGTAGYDEGAQDPMSLAGKVLRLRDDGSVPPDNPFVGKDGARPEIYTLGHRSPMGFHPANRPVAQRHGTERQRRSTC